MLGTRMRRLRLARGMTQKELADPKYSYAYVSTIEAGRRTPSREAIEHFATRLGVTPDELVTGRPADLEARLELSLQEATVTLSGEAGDDAESCVPGHREGRQPLQPPADPIQGRRGAGAVVRAPIATGGSARPSPERAGPAQGRACHRVGRRGRRQGALPRSAR